MLKVLNLSVLLVAPLLALPCAAQPQHAAQAAAEADEAHGPTVEDATLRVEHDSAQMIRGVQVPYRVVASTQPVWNSDGEEIASLFYTYYERTDITDQSLRPLVFSFNGGPGSASIWMHIAYTGPKLLRIDDEGYPVQPYGIQDNPNSILDVADIVYVDPVNTGFSRILGDQERAQFFGVNEDIAYLAKWIDTFVTRQSRWTSPKYLIGESYGTTRVAGLAARLQGSQWMYLNGVILVSPTDLGLKREGPVGDALPLPYYAATAWYHQRLSKALQNRELEDLLAEVEQFTLDQLLPALARGGTLPVPERKRIAARYAAYSGISAKVVEQHNMAIPTSFFWKELLRDEGLTVGRLDSRYRGLDRSDAGNRPDFDPALSAWNHAFAPAINHYLRDILGFQSELQYWLFGPVHTWNRYGHRTGRQLQQAMDQHPYLHVMVQSG